MSWLGKIMTFLVFIGALVWAYFTVAAYATRTNWQTRAAALEKSLKESEANRNVEQRQWQKERSEMTALLEAEKERTKTLNLNYDNLASDSKKLDDVNKTLTASLSSADIIAKKKDVSEMAMLIELKATRDRNTALEDGTVELVRKKEEAERDRLRAVNERDLQEAIAKENIAKVLDLQSRLNDLVRSGSGTSAVLRTVDKVPAPLPDNIRGTVVRDISGDFVQISIGIDAGLEPGSKLDIYRETGGGQYLGTLIVTKSVYPKEAVAEFRPARGVPVSQLRPDELPRKGDTVGQISLGSTGRR